jgi:hypothetical protein
MVILHRLLKLQVEGREIDVPVRIHLPVDNGDSWHCEYEIAWPNKPRKTKIHGIDSVQSLLLALQTIAVELYSSEAHKSGKLKWEKPGDGYGFPLHPATRDLHEGDDKLM